MRLLSIILLLSLSCSPSNQAPSPASLTSAVSALTALVSPNSSCFDPGAPPYSAVPDDGLSDRVALQAAASDAAAWSVAHDNAPTVVCLGAGVWNCDRAPIGSYNRFSCVSVHSGNVIFQGVGEATKVALTGNQQLGDIVVISHDPGSSGGVQDLMMVSGDATNTSEQTHMMGTTGVCSGANCLPIRNLSYRRVICDHPAATDGSRKGDCIRLLGNTPPALDGSTPGTNIYGVVIDHVQFRRCARSGIQPQRGVHDAVITNNEFWCNQPIHGEATGGTQELENTNIEVTANVFHATEMDGSTFSSDYDIQLSGAGMPYHGIHIHHNTMNRGINLYRIADAEVDHETIVMTKRDGYGVIEVENKCSGLKIHHVTLTRNGSNGPVIRLMPHSSNTCNNATITNNVINQNTIKESVYTESVSTLLLANNIINVAGTTPQAVVYARSTIASVTDFIVQNNQITGTVGYGVYFAAAPYAFGTGNEVSGNTISTVTVAGLSCGGAGGFAPITAFGNTWNLPPTCPGVTFIQP